MIKIRRDQIVRRILIKLLKKYIVNELYARPLFLSIAASSSFYPDYVILHRLRQATENPTVLAVR
jgi:hypothetical protein